MTSNDGSQWRLCSQCGNGYPVVAPDLPALLQVWARNRVENLDDGAARAAAWEYRKTFSQITARRSYRLFSPLVGNPQAKNMVDIACGLGETVRYFADHGWDAEGVDADPNVATLHRELGIRSHIGQIETMPVRRSYDLIHIAHAVYFITEPLAFLRQVGAMLKPGGVLAVVLANFLASFDCGLPSRQHTFFPTGASMRYALARAGFETFLVRRISGSIYMAARPTPRVALPRVRVRCIHWGYRTKAARYQIIGRPYLALRAMAKRLLGHRH